MIRKELSLEASYIPNWGMEEGVREFISNAFDARTEMGCEVDIRYDIERKKLFIITRGEILSREVLLFGHSTKASRGDTIGHFGEGLKLGSLACVRAGYDVIIRTGSETWRPIICRSESYNANVLAIEINKGNKYQNRVAIEIENVELEDWATIKNSFLELNSISDEDRIRSGYYGEVILNPKFKGQIFVKGVKVEYVPDFDYGYNLFMVSTDRDRKMVNPWELKYAIRNLWSESVGFSAVAKQKFINAISGSGADIKIDSENDFYLNDKNLDDVVSDFKNKYGENAYPVSNSSEAREVEFFGFNGVIVNNSYRIILYKKLGNFESLQRKYKNSAKKIYTFAELTDEENKNINEAVSDIKTAIPDFNHNLFDVVDFIDPDLNGLYNENKRIFVARSVINDFKKLRIVLIHEITHLLDSDGTKVHEDAMCEIWAEMFKHLKNAST